MSLILKYKRYLPISYDTPIISLDEGSTPLLKSKHLSTIIGRGFDVYLKFEGANPTGSFKDRGMAMAISKAKEEGARAVMCASTGNTAASAAAYAAKAGLKAIVVIPEGAIALGKLSQALLHGALVIAIKGNFDDALRIVREITSKYPICLVNSINPYRIEGQKTAAFEICDQLGKVSPDYLAIPVGNAGNITAYWKGFKEYKEAEEVDNLPKMLGFQAEGAAPIVRRMVIKHPSTCATAIRIGNPASWKSAEQARDESCGLIEMVTDSQIISAYKLLAEKEGLFCEPASCASVAGILKLKELGYFKETATTKRIVCVLTGHGLKDPDIAIKTVEHPKITGSDTASVIEIIEPYL
jgi:threonine synthase